MKFGCSKDWPEAQWNSVNKRRKSGGSVANGTHKTVILRRAQTDGPQQYSTVLNTVIRGSWGHQNLHWSVCLCPYLPCLLSAWASSLQSFQGEAYHSWPTDNWVDCPWDQADCVQMSNSSSTISTKQREREREHHSNQIQINFYTN